MHAALDGEPARLPSPLRLWVEPGALRLLVPPATDEEPAQRTCVFPLEQVQDFMSRSGGRSQPAFYLQLCDDPNGKIDIVKTAGYWLQGAKDRGIRHLCWDGCMFPNAMLENPQTWNTILAKMIQVRDAHGWN